MQNNDIEHSNTAAAEEIKDQNSTNNEKSILDRIGGDKYAYSDVLG